MKAPDHKRLKPPPPRVMLKNIKRLLQIMAEGHQLKLMLVFVFIIVSVLANVAGSLFLEILIDDHIAPLMTMEIPYFGDLLLVIGLMGIIYLSGVFASLFFNRIMVDIAQNAMKKVRDTMFTQMQELPIQYFDTHSHGDLMSRYTNDTDTLRQLITQSLPHMFSSLMTVIFVLVAMLMTSPHLTVMVLLFSVLIIFVSRKVASRSGRFFREQQIALGRTNGYIEELINGQKVVKVFNYEDKAKESFDRLNNDLCYQATQANRFANILMPIMGNMGHLQYVLIAIAGGLLAVNGVAGLSLGAIAAFLQLSRSFSMPINQISQQINAVIMAMAGADRVFQLMDETQEADHGDVTLVHACLDEQGELTETCDRTGLWAWKQPHMDGSFTYRKLEGDVRLDNVDFSYDGKTVVLKNINLFAEPGQKIAFVGATGAGKTTITNLLNRFYDINDGSIRYDGININQIRKPDLRRSLSMVLQDTNLFTGTVLDNIRYGRLNATDEEIVEAARRANAHGFISMLPESYETQLTGDASGLSQGQRQLISIARAEIADAPVMILDEATSSIDTRTEIIVQRGMDALMKERTVFVIAHRLSTVRNADVIMVLDQGEIIERGSHNELLQAQGVYYQLYTGAAVLS